MANLTELPNIGAHAAGQLAEVGIETPEDLVALGAEQAWLKLQAIDPGVRLHQPLRIGGCRAGHPQKGTRPGPQAGTQGLLERTQACMRGLLS